MLSHVELFATPWTVAHQTPLSMKFSRQEYWSRLPFPTPGDLPNPGIEPASLWVSCIGSWFLYHCTTWEVKFFSQIQHIQFSLVAQSCPTLCNPRNRSTPDLPVYHQLPESTQTHVHWTSDAIQPSHPLSSPSPPALNLSQHQGLFKWVSSSHQVAKVLELQLQHQTSQWTPRTDLL